MTDKIGLIAGNGQFPLLFAKAARRKGLQVYAVGYQGETDPVLAEHVSMLEWLYIGQVKRIIKFFREHKIARAVMIGGVAKARLPSPALVYWQSLPPSRDPPFLQTPPCSGGRVAPHWASIA